MSGDALFLANSKEYKGAYLLGTRVGLGRFLLQGVFPAQELNQGLPHCGQMLWLPKPLWKPHLLSYVTLNITTYHRKSWGKRKLLNGVKVIGAEGKFVKLIKCSISSFKRLLKVSFFSAADIMGQTELDTAISNTRLLSFVQAFKNILHNPDNFLNCLFEGATPMQVPKW